MGLNVGISEDGEVFVEGLWEDSPADIAGLEVGDRIVSLQLYEPVRPDNLMKLQYALRDDRVSTIELEVFSGDTGRRIVLEKANLF